MDKNKAAPKLKNFPLVLWLNLDRYPERRKYMEEHLAYWQIENHHRITGIDGSDDATDRLKGRVPDNMNPGEIGCVLTHLEAIKYFVNETPLTQLVKFGLKFIKTLKEIRV